MFKNISIFTRLVILTAVMVIALLINALIGWSGFQAATDGMDSVYHGGVEEILQLSNLTNIYEIKIGDSVHKVLNGEMAWGEGEKNIKEGVEKIDSTWSAYLEKVSRLQEVNAPVIKSHIDNLQDHLKAATPGFKDLQAIFRRQNQEALASFSSREFYPLVDPILKELDGLIKQHIANTTSDYENAQKRISDYKKLMILGFIIALVLSVLTAIWITWSISKPLKTAVDAINQVAQGDVMLEIEAGSKNEMGRLFAAMKKMVDSNKEMAESLTAISKGDLTVSVKPRSDRDILGMALVSMTKKLKKIIGSIQADVVALNNSSQEIVNSVSQVAVGSSETAAAVTETTTTVEELKQTAQVSAEKAKDVLMSAEETLHVVKNSERSLQTTIEDMNQINEKMRIISTGIIKLSELSQTIGEIIDTVNDLAEQSNLLAVNAAIEAAKAGEQGKGFSVVAHEIRTLAEQSKAATVQVRGILNDIQNATSAAVLATEQGSKAVEKGVVQSSQTNESMRTLVVSMSHVTQAVNQISISSQQQLIGVGQVTVAMNNINEAAKQYVDNMSTIENTVIALNTIGKTLKQITDQYVLKESEDGKGFKKMRPASEDQEDILIHKSFSL